MKIVGSILCIAAILAAFGQIIRHEPDTTAHHIQQWAFIGVLLAIGIPLSQGKRKVSK